VPPPREKVVRSLTRAVLCAARHRTATVRERPRNALFLAVTALESGLALNLSLDFAHLDQRLAGYRTLNLLNSIGDPTFVRTVLYLQIARDYIPAPKANYRRPLERAGQSRRRERRSGLPWRRDSPLQARLRDQEQGRAKGLGRSSR